MLFESIQNREELFNLARVSKDPEDLRRARIAKKETATLTKNSQRNFIVGKLEESYGNNQMFWDTIKLVLLDGSTKSIETVRDEIQCKRHNNQIKRSSQYPHLNEYLWALF